MPRRREGARVLGPYEENGKWRLIEVAGNGSRTAHFTDSERAAEKLKQRLSKGLVQISVAEAVDAWVKDVEISGRIMSETLVGYRDRVETLCGSVLAEPVHVLTPHRAERLYIAETERVNPRTGRPIAVASHRMSLRVARLFGAWAVSAGHLRENPFASVTPIGRPNAGKPQLRLDEARRFVATALQLTQEGDVLALAAACLLLLGLRASEIVQRQVRDLDDGGRLLWVPRSKTKAGRRTLEVPEDLRPALLAVAGNRRGDELLFSQGLGKMQPANYRRAMWYVVRRVCRVAGVPEICPHSLRGLHATLALSRGVSSHAVAAALGHGSFAVTAKHYAAPGSVERATAEKVRELLAENRSEPDPNRV